MQSVGHAFKNALTSKAELAVIAEVKRKSPSAGTFVLVSELLRQQSSMSEAVHPVFRY